MKIFGEAVLALRGAFELLAKLQSCEDRLGPPKAHILQSAIALGERSAALDTLEAIDSCIDRSPGGISLHSQVWPKIQKRDESPTPIFIARLSNICNFGKNVYISVLLSICC